MRCLSVLAVFVVLTASLRAPARAAFGTADDLGPRASTATTTVIAVVAHRNEAQLATFLAAIAAGRAKPISHARFVATYAPTPQSVAFVATYLQSCGFHIDRISESMVFANAPAATVERTFGTSIHNVRSLRRADAYVATEPSRYPSAIAPYLRTVVIDDVPVRRVR